MYTVSRNLRTFSAAHRLNKGYQDKCRHLHGHSYNVCVTLASDALNEYDFVIDFADIKLLFDDWVQTHWDHVTLVSEQDITLLEFLKREEQDHFVIPGGRNTSSEALAEFLFEQFTEILAQQRGYSNRVTLIVVRVYESDCSYAEYRLR